MTGQDGPNMAEYLLKNTSHRIVGTVRLLSNKNHANMEECVGHPRFTWMVMDIMDEYSVREVFKKVCPDYFINFAAQSFVGESWKQPKLTFMTNSVAIITILEIIRELNPSCRFYSAGTSEEFGDVDQFPITLHHLIKPKSPYGASKCAARHIVRVYRESYHLYAVHCICFNHEGIRRGEQFVTRKITSNLARIKYELDHGIDPHSFELGNIEARRDWSDSEDFVEAIWHIMNRDHPKEYILASNSAHSVKEFVDVACDCLGLKVWWYIDENNPLKTELRIGDYPIIKISKKYYRPADVQQLVGDSSEVLKDFDWVPKIDFYHLVKKMVEYDYAREELDRC